MRPAVVTEWMQWGLARHGMLLCALIVTYFLAGKLGLHFAFVHASASPVWPPTGIALAAILLFGRRVWPAIFIGALLVNVSVAGAIDSSIGIAAGNTVEAVIGAALVERYAGGAHAFDRARNFLGFILSLAIATPICATIGVASLVAAGEAPPSQFVAIWLTWWLGDSAGALIVAPLLLLWSKVPEADPLRERPAEALLLGLVVLVVGLLVFAHQDLRRYPLPFLCIPPLIWAAFRFGPREVATAVLVMSAIATWATLHGAGPFVMATENESLLLLQSFMATIAALTLPVAALVSEREAVESERVALLEREQAARREAEAANVARDEFIAMLSHELRNPLAAITNASQVLVTTAHQEEFAARAIDIIRRQARHLTRLIEDLLDVARVSTGKIVLQKERVNLADLVQKCIGVLEGAGRLRGHQLVFEGDPVWVDADPARLSQVVDNVVGNAIKYTPPPGHIEVRTASEDDEAVLTVRDSGIGISPELLPRIFDAFTQGPRSLDRAEGGLGLGLTLASRLVRAHGGRIVATSEGPARGALFTVRLPAARVPITGGRSSPAREERLTARRILIVEDDADVREALRMQLRLAGHAVDEAKSGGEAIEVAERVKPDVVLLDIGLPGMDGYQVAQRLRAANGSVHVIAITGYGQAQDRARALAAGIEVHLVKPVDAAELNRWLAATA